ncbi:MAG: hypothetical protein OXN83_02135 [Oligoflexia bacterium]|nr:hypothetical protein [Oligoflexia bacterium]
MPERILGFLACVGELFYKTVSNRRYKYPALYFLKLRLPNFEGIYLGCLKPLLKPEELMGYQA